MKVQLELSASEYEFLMRNNKNKPKEEISKNKKINENDWKSGRSEDEIRNIFLA